VVDVLQEVIQELLQSDRYMQQQMAWIAECTVDARLRNALLFASTEEYCLRQCVTNHYWFTGLLTTCVVRSGEPNVPPMI